MSRISADLIEDFGGLQALEAEWWDLWDRCPGALPFQAPAWLISWWRHFSPGVLFTAAVRIDGRLVGLAPGYIEDGPLGRRILPLGISLSDHLDILVDPEHEDAAMAGLVSAALSRSADWESWELENLLPQAEALKLPVPDGFADEVMRQDACPVVFVPDGVRKLADLIPKRKRQNLKLALNRCSRRGFLRVDRADRAGASGALEHLFRLHGARWKSRGEEGGLASTTVQAFQLEAVSGLAEAGLLRLYTLSIQGRIIAAHYGLLHRGRAYVYVTGFDPDFAFESPGVVIMAHAIQDALDEGCREIDFLRGQEAYKYEWGAVDRWDLKRSIRHG